jgi:hypothetical protein
MKRLLSILFALSLVVGLATGAGAALTFDVDFWATGNPVNNYAKSGPGDQGGTFDLFVGESINVDIYFSTDQDLVAASWDLQFDPSNLAVSGTQAAGAPWLAALDSFEFASGSVKYQTGVFPPTTVTGNNNFFGSVLFECTGVSVDTLTLANYLGFLTEDPANNVNFSPVNLGTLNQNVVPIPGAVWLLGTGLIGLVGIRRKRRN